MMATWLCIGLQCISCGIVCTNVYCMCTHCTVCVLCSPFHLLNSMYVFVYVTVVAYYEYVHVCEFSTGVLRMLDVRSE